MRLVCAVGLMLGLPAFASSSIASTSKPSSPQLVSSSPAPKGPPRVQPVNPGGGGGIHCATLCGANAVACSLTYNATGDTPSPSCDLYCEYADGTTVLRSIPCP